jgi:hypothetical protein
MLIVLKRRHLTESQRAMVAASLANMPHGGDRKSANQAANLPLDRTHVAEHTQICGTSQSDAAELLNVSERTVANAAKVKTEGAPELIQAVQSGVVSVSAAADVATFSLELHFVWAYKEGVDSYYL